MLAKYKREFVEKEVAAAMPRLGHGNAQDALAAVGRGELSGSDVLKAMGIAVDETKTRERSRKVVAKKSDAVDEHSIPVRGVARSAALTIAPETGAVPGERIVGILMPGEGIRIYPIFARALEQFDNQPERWVDLAWDAAGAEQSFPARIKVTILNEVGSLSAVTQTISDGGANIDALSMVARAGAKDFFDLDITVEVHDLKHLNDIMAGLRAKSPVSSVERMAG
jgi:(p)ppGpp synthase/HD superfamily hydrolase